MTTMMMMMMKIGALQMFLHEGRVFEHPVIKSINVGWQK